MSIYLIAQITINDRVEYAKYEAGFMDIFEKYEGTMRSVDEDAETLEGEWQATRTVVIEFPNRDRAMDWYQSAEYQALAKHRFSASKANTILVQGMS